MRKSFQKLVSALRKAVFQRYGIVNAQADDYEIDYLIAPGLGGKRRHSQSLAAALFIYNLECSRFSIL